jgi:bis(5'-adenosyl)-triphosphatase
MDCPFCKPTIKESVFAESAGFMAIYNIAPILAGHSLIIPKNHIHSILELSKDALSEMTLFSQGVTTLLLKTFIAEAFNWSVQDKEFAGQTVSHLHLHIVPRYPYDLPSPGDWYPMIEKNFSDILDETSRQRLTSEQLKQIVLRLRQDALKAGLYFSE